MGRLLVLVGLIAGLALALPDTTQATSLDEIKILVASDAEFNDRFGRGAAISGDTMIVGAPGEDTAGVSAGAGYVYQRNAGGTDNWGEVTKLIASDAQPSKLFAFSTAIDGDTAVVSAHGGGGGVAYVFARDEGGPDNWGEVTKLVSSDIQAVDGFGFSVAISGDTILIGARTEDVGGNDAGAAYLFQRNAGGADNWGEVKKLLASDAQAEDEFGYDVAISGDTAVIGAHYEATGGTRAGAAYVFHRDLGGTDNWGEAKKLTASDAIGGEWFGHVIAVNGDTAVVGALLGHIGVLSTGAAYVFRRDAGGADNWGEVKKLTASDAEFGDNLGFGVAVSGETVVVGARHEDAKASNAGAAYVFRRSAGGADNWGEVTKLTASNAAADDQFGLGVAISGDIAIVGANGQDMQATGAGAAYVYDLQLLKPTATITPSPTPTPCPPAGCTVGGIALDSELRTLPLKAADSSGSWWVVGAAIVAMAGLMAIGGAWYARPREA